MTKFSAGLLLFKVADDGSITVLLVHPGGPFWRNKEEHAWSIPKGEYDLEEDPAAAAEREFAEELGMPAPSGPRIDLGKVRQSSGKNVRAWGVHAEHFSIETVVSNLFEMEWPPRSGMRQEFPEVDRAQWMTLDEAKVHLVTAQVDFLDRLEAELASTETERSGST
jgi:predicted NUDIX family NTP pyrophosphohydrolase